MCETMAQSNMIVKLSKLLGHAELILSSRVTSIDMLVLMKVNLESIVLSLQLRALRCRFPWLQILKPVLHRGIR